MPSSSPATAAPPARDAPVEEPERRAERDRRAAESEPSSRRRSREPEPEPEPSRSAEPEAVAVVDDATMVPTEVTLAPSTEDFDQLWGATVHSAPAVAAEQPAPRRPRSASQGDHDGATISAAELRALRQQAPARATTRRPPCCR